MYISSKTRRLDRPDVHGAGGCPISDQIPTYEIGDPTQLCSAGLNAANLPVNLPSPGFSSSCSKYTQPCWFAGMELL